MYKRASLLLILLVTVAFAASGCFEGFFGPTTSETDAVNAVVNAFMGSLRDADDTAMSGLLASTVTSSNWVDWIGVEDGTYGADEFAAAWTDLQLPVEFIDWTDEPEGVDRTITISGLQFVEGPRTTVNGNHAVSTGRIALDLDHAADWFDDRASLHEGDVSTTTGLVNTVSDIFTVRLELDKIESNWKITYFMLHEGERQTTMLNTWDAFADTLVGIDAFEDGSYGVEAEINEALSVCTDPFFWNGFASGWNVFAGITTHYEWREVLKDAFRLEETEGPWPDQLTLSWYRYIALDLSNAVPMELSAYGGTIRAEVRAYVGEYESVTDLDDLDEDYASAPYLVDASDESGIAELKFVVRGGRWLLSNISYQSLGPNFGGLN